MRGIDHIINKEGVKHAKRANIYCRIEINGTNNCLTILKDHNKTLAATPQKA